MELELDHVGPRRLSTRRRVVVRHGDEKVARIRLGRGLWHAQGECLADQNKYVYEVDRGYPLVRGRWPLGRTRVSMRRVCDEATVGYAVQPRRWTRRVACRGGVQFTHEGVTYGLRPLKGRHGGPRSTPMASPPGRSCLSWAKVAATRPCPPFSMKKRGCC